MSSMPHPVQKGNCGFGSSKGTRCSTEIPLLPIRFWASLSTFLAARCFMTHSTALATSPEQNRRALEA